MTFSGVQITTSQSESDSFTTGPYIDDLEFEIMTNQDQRMISLQAGTTHMHSGFFDPVHLPSIETNPDIDVY